MYLRLKGAAGLTPAQLSFNYPLVRGAPPESPGRISVNPACTARAGLPTPAGDFLARREIPIRHFWAQDMERPHLKRQPAALAFATWFLVGLAACAGYTSSGNHGNPGGSVAPMITAQPTNQTVNAGVTATFTVMATGTAPLSYQWQSAPSGSMTYTNIAG